MMCASIGNTKAAVLPEPVFAIPCAQGRKQTAVFTEQIFYPGASQAQEAKLTQAFSRRLSMRTRISLPERAAGSD